MISAKFNQEDIDRILGKLNRTLEESRTYAFTWQYTLLNEYREQVMQAMGTVSARGGYPHISFDTTSGYMKWRSLRPYTIREKLKHRGVSASEYNKLNPGQLYSKYASELSIWVDTGETRESVKIYPSIKFAGIMDASTLDKANTTEYGDPTRNIPPRPLFAVANFAIMTSIHNMLQNDNSWLAQRMRTSFCSLAVSYGWGS